MVLRNSTLGWLALHLKKLVTWSNRDEDWKNANSLFQRCFLCHRRPHPFNNGQFFQRLINKSRMVMKFVSHGALMINRGTRILFVFHLYSCSKHNLSTLSNDVFERRTSTGSEAFSLFICLDANKLVLLSFFSLLKTIYPRVSTKPLPNDAKSPLPVDVRRSKTLLLKQRQRRRQWKRR